MPVIIPAALIKHPDKNNIRGWGYGRLSQESYLAGTGSTDQVKSEVGEETDECLLAGAQLDLASSFGPGEMELPPFIVDHSTSINPIRKRIPHWHTYRPIQSRQFLIEAPFPSDSSCVKLIVKASHTPNTY